MSAHLDGYMKALKQARKLNKEAEAVSDLMIGARRGAGARREQRFPITRAHGMGQAAPGACAPPGQTNLPVGTPVGGPCPPEFLCDCDLIGATTLGNAPIVPGAAWQITVTDFDAVALQAVAIWFTAFVADDADSLANPVIEIPTLITQVRVGQNGQLRVAGIPNGLNSAAFAATREPVCVDWAPFRSQNGQELTIDGTNIVVAPADMHVFMVLWCNVLQ